MDSEYVNILKRKAYTTLEFEPRTKKVKVEILPFQIVIEMPPSSVGLTVNKPSNLEKAIQSKPRNKKRSYKRSNKVKQEIERHRRDKESGKIDEALNRIKQKRAEAETLRKAKHIIDTGFTKPKFC
jgi:hypothetical protein